MKTEKLVTVNEEMMATMWTRWFMDSISADNDCPYPSLHLGGLEFLFGSCSMQLDPATSCCRALTA